MFLNKDTTSMYEDRLEMELTWGTIL